MGCWNGTCMISNLPIIDGEKVKLVLLHNPHFIQDRSDNLFTSSGVCYHNTYLQPAFFPITGEYDDYGNITNVEKDWNYDLITKVLKKELGEKIVVDGDEKDNWVLEDVLEGIERGDITYVGVDRVERKNKKFAQLMVDSMPDNEDEIKEGYVMEEYLKCKKLVEKDLVPEEQNLRMSFVMIREDIWNHVVDKYEGEYFNPKRRNNDGDDVPYTISGKEYYRFKFDNYVNLAKDTIKKVSEESDNSDRMKEYLIKDILRSSIFDESYAGSSHLYSPEYYSTRLYKSVENGEDVEYIFKSWSELMSISSFIGSTRRLWMIQSGAGSQYEGWDDHMIIGEKVKEICEAKIKEQEEWENG